jgi:hypothetical protein
MMVYIAEGSTPALNISWFLHQLKLKDSLWFKLCVLLLLVKFFCLRVVLGPYLVHHLLTHRDTWGEDADVMFVFNLLICVFFMLLNFYWFFLLVSMAMK